VLFIYRQSHHTSKNDGAWAELGDRCLSPLNLSTLIGNKASPTRHKLLKGRQSDPGMKIWMAALALYRLAVLWTDVSLSLLTWGKLGSWKRLSAEHRPDQ